MATKIYIKFRKTGPPTLPYLGNILKNTLFFCLPKTYVLLTSQNLFSSLSNCIVYDSLINICKTNMLWLFFLNGLYIGRNKEGTVRFRGGKMCVTGLDGSSNLFVSSDVLSWRGILVKLVMHQISVDEIENPCYWINRCRFDMVIPSILSTQYWASLIFFTIYCYWQNWSLLCPKRTMAIFYKNQGQGFNL